MKLHKLEVLQAVRATTGYSIYIGDYLERMRVIRTNRGEKGHPWTRHQRLKILKQLEKEGYIWRPLVYSDGLYGYKWSVTEKGRYLLDKIVLWIKAAEEISREVGKHSTREFMELLL